MIESSQDNYPKQPEVGIPHPIEKEFRDQLLILIDDYRGKITYAQSIGVLEMVKQELVADCINLKFDD